LEVAKESRESARIPSLHRLNGIIAGSQMQYKSYLPFPSERRGKCYSVDQNYLPEENAVLA
jgi:hypothetical protein